MQGEFGPLVTLRIALGSATAFIVAHFLDISIFNFFREEKWWKAPLISSILGSSIDTIIFFFIAFSSVMSFLEPSNDVTWASEQIPILGILGTAPFWVSLANADFLVNSLDNLSGSQDLISLRSRGLSVRPFYRIRDLATAAEEKYRSTEQQLTAKLKDLQKKLSGLNMEEKPGAKAPVLTTEQTKAFQKFRSEMLDVRRQLREVQHLSLIHI